MLKVEGYRGRLRCLVVGSGSLGGAVAAMLAPYADIFCYDVSALLVNNLNNEGIRIKIDGRWHRAKVSASAEPEALRGLDFDCFIVATKCADVIDALKALFPFCLPRAIVFFENGFLTPSQIRVVPKSVAIYRGVTTMAVKADGQGRVEVYHEGQFFGGLVRGADAGFNSTVVSLRQRGIGVRRVADYRRAEWAKAVFNAVMNPLPIIFGGGYDIIRTNASAYSMVCHAVREGLQTARAWGIRPAFDPMRIVRGLRAGTFGRMKHSGSMYYDFIAGRALELDEITGAIIRQAQQKGVAVPVLSSIYNKVRLLEKGSHGAGKR